MKRRALLAFVVLPLVLSACSDEFTQQTIKTPRGEVGYKVRARPDDGKLAEGVRDVSSSELSRIRESASRSPSFIARYVPEAQRRNDQLDNLDLAFTAWLNSSNPTKELAHEVEAIVGAALGEYCIARLPVRWSVVSDSQGSDFALVGQNPPSRSFPLAAVRYRIEDRKTDFIGAYYEALVHLRKQ